MVFIYKAGTEAINSKPRGPEKMMRSVYLFVFCPNRFHVHLYLSLTRQIPKEGGNSGETLFKRKGWRIALFLSLRGLSSEIKLSVVVMVPAAFCCALMILPDDTVLNISASSAETHVHTLKGKEHIYMLIWDTKANTGKEIKCLLSWPL